MRELMGKKKIVVYEVIPPKGTDLGRCMDLCTAMKGVGVDIVAITDMPVGSVRMAPWAVGKHLLEKGIEPLVHFTRTSRNVLRIESDLLGMYSLGIENVLLLSGDDPKLGDYPNATRVEDISITDLIRLTKLMNSGTDLAGNELKGKTNLFVGAVFNPFSEHDLKRAEEKVGVGVDFLVSQPVFGRELDVDLNVPVIASVAFFRSFKQMESFSNVPGIDIPSHFFEMTRGKSKEYLMDFTFDRMLEVVESIFDSVAGFYIPGIVRDVEKVEKLVEFVRDLSKRSS